MSVQKTAEKNLSINLHKKYVIEYIRQKTFCGCFHRKWVRSKKFKWWRIGFLRPTVFIYFFFQVHHVLILFFFALSTFLQLKLVERLKSYRLRPHLFKSNIQFGRKIFHTFCLKTNIFSESFKVLNTFLKHFSKQEAEVISFHTSIFYLKPLEYFLEDLTVDWVPK